MEQARKRLVELLIDADYVTSKDSKYSWWKKDVTVGAIKNNYSKYIYLYCINENHNVKKGVFYIDYDSIWSVLKSENNMSDQQIKDFTQSMLGERYNFGDIATDENILQRRLYLGEHYNFGDIATSLTNGFNRLSLEETLQLLIYNTWNKQENV